LLGPLSGDSLEGLISSNSLAITVNPAIDVQWQPLASDLNIELRLSTQGQDASLSASGTDTLITKNQNVQLSAYAGQHIVVDIALHHRYPIADEKIVLPAFEGFDVLTEYEQRRPNIEDDEKPGRVIAWRYHVFAQRSGPQRIGIVSWTGTTIKSRTQRADFERTTQTANIEILASRQSNNWWLPASSVTLSDSWSQDVRNLSAGDEIIRTITLDATDVLASHLPVIEPLESRAISSTLIKQTRTQKLIGESIKASAQFTYRMVAQSPIPVFLDTVRVPWYDTVSQTDREAIIPARRINVGLPDRADLLAELATNSHWYSAILLKLRSSAQRFAFWHITLTVLALLLLLLIGLECKRAVLSRGKGSDHHKNRYLPEL